MCETLDRYQQRGSPGSEDGPLWIDIDPSLDFGALRRLFEGENSEGWISPALTWRHLLYDPHDERFRHHAPIRVESHLIRVKWAMGYHDFFSELRDQGLRPAGLRECFVFGKTYPRLLRHDSDIVGPGTQWFHSPCGSLVGIPCIRWVRGGQRQLSIRWTSPGLAPPLRVLALSKQAPAPAD